MKRGSTLGLYKLLFSVVFFVSSPSIANTFEINNEPIPAIELSKSDEQTRKQKIFCHIDTHIFDHFDFVKAYAIPRISKELSFLLQPQTTIDDRKIQVAEDIDRGDLFHAHIRTPLIDFNPGDSLGLNTELIQPDNIHLQYHAYETESFQVQKWVGQLRSIQHLSLIHI